MLGGPRLWPAIVVGRLLAAYLTGSEQPFWVDAGIAAGNGLSALVSAVLLRRMRISPLLESLPDFSRYVIYGAVLSAVLSALCGVTTLTIGAGLPLDRARDVFSFWVVGNVVGVLTIAPLTQIVGMRRRADLLKELTSIRTIAPIVVAAVATWLIFFNARAENFPVWYVIPLLIWPALTSRLAAIITLVLLAAIVVGAVGVGMTPFNVAGSIQEEQVLLSQKFIAIVSLMVLCLSVVASGRARTGENELRLALEGADQGIFLYDPVRGRTNWDARTSELFGLPPMPNSLTDEEIQALIHPDDRLLAAQAIDQALDTSREGAYAVEYRVVGADGSSKWVSVHGRAEFAGVGRFRIPVSIRGVARDITERKRSEEQFIVLSKEVAHRAKNQLAVIQSIVSRSLVAPTTLDEGREALLGRLHSIAGAFDLLNANSMEDVSLEKIVKLGLVQYGGRYSLSGPEVLVRNQSVQSFSLLFHELATNAAKYGALSGPDGTLKIAWEVGPAEFALSWTEHSPTLDLKPAQNQTQGFGSFLIDRVVPRQLSGHSTRYINPCGLVYELKCPLARVTAGA